MTARTNGETIALVSCVKQKVSGPCPAKDLYISPLFRYMRAYAVQQADRWFILSAEYGLVDPERQLVRYEQTLSGVSAAARRAWAHRVYEQMKDADLLRRGISFLWLAGKTYKQDLSRKLEGFQQHDPLAGLGIGKRLAWLKAATSTM